MEINYHPCLYCGKIIKKRVSESRNRVKNRRYCSLECGRKKMAENKIGWWSSLNTITQRIGDKKKEVDKIDEIAPVIEDKRFFKDFDKDYGELLDQLE